MDSKEKAKRYNLMKNYGLTLEEFREIEKKQDYKCWICKNKPKNKCLNIDHRHVPKYKKMKPEDKKKEVRGGLCMRCNKFTVGSLEIHKNARYILEQLVEYFKVFKMKGDK